MGFSCNLYCKFYLNFFQTVHKGEPKSDICRLVSSTSLGWDRYTDRNKAAFYLFLLLKVLEYSYLWEDKRIKRIIYINCIYIKCFNCLTHAQLLKIKIRAICLPSIVINNENGSSDLDYQSDDSFHLRSSVCCGHLTKLVQSALDFDKDLGLCWNQEYHPWSVKVKLVDLRKHMKYRLLVPWSSVVCAFPLPSWEIFKSQTRTFN